MKKVRNSPKYLHNTKYNFECTKTDGHKLDKSFWQRMSGKAKLSLIATIAAVTIVTPTLSNAVQNYNYPNISGIEINVNNIEDKNTLDYWINAYNTVDKKDSKDYIMTQIAEYSNDIEKDALSSVKEIILEKIKDNPRENDFSYNNIDSIGDITISYINDPGLGETFNIKNSKGAFLNIDISDSMKSVIRNVGKLQDLQEQKDANKKDIGQQTLRIIKSVNDLNEHEHSAENKKEGLFNKKDNLEISDSKIDNDRDDK